MNVLREGSRHIAIIKRFAIIVVLLTVAGIVSSRSVVHKKAKHVAHESPQEISSEGDGVYIKSTPLGSPLSREDSVLKASAKTLQGLGLEAIVPTGWPSSKAKRPTNRKRRHKHSPGDSTRAHDVTTDVITYSSASSNDYTQATNESREVRAFGHTPSEVEQIMQPLLNETESLEEDLNSLENIFTTREPEIELKVLEKKFGDREAISQKLELLNDVAVTIGSPIYAEVEENANVTPKEKRAYKDITTEYNNSPDSNTVRKHKAFHISIPKETSATPDTSMNAISNSLYNETVNTIASDEITKENSTIERPMRRDFINISTKSIYSLDSTQQVRDIDISEENMTSDAIVHDVQERNDIAEFKISETTTETGLTWQDDTIEDTVTVTDITSEVTSPTVSSAKSGVFRSTSASIQKKAVAEFFDDQNNIQPQPKTYETKANIDIKPIPISGVEISNDEDRKTITYSGKQNLQEGVIKIDIQIPVDILRRKVHPKKTRQKPVEVLKNEDGLIDSIRSFGENLNKINTAKREEASEDSVRMHKHKDRRNVAESTSQKLNKSLHSDAHTITSSATMPTKSKKPGRIRSQKLEHTDGKLEHTDGTDKTINVRSDVEELQFDSNAISKKAHKLTDDLQRLLVQLKKNDSPTILAKVRDVQQLDPNVDNESFVELLTKMPAKVRDVPQLENNSNADNESFAELLLKLPAKVRDGPQLENKTTADNESFAEFRLKITNDFNETTDNNTSRQMTHIQPLNDVDRPKLNRMLKRIVNAIREVLGRNSGNITLDDRERILKAYSKILPKFLKSWIVSRSDYFIKIKVNTD